MTATEKVSCGDDSIPACKERSKKASELKASEMGSVVFVNSLTEVKNFKLSKEVLRSEVQATLSNQVFTNQQMVGDAEYQTTITANVEPVIGDTLRAQMAEVIRAQVYVIVGGKIDFSPIQNPSPMANEAQDNEELAELNRDKANKGKKNKIVENEAPEEIVVRQQVVPPSAPRKPEKPTFTF